MTGHDYFNRTVVWHLTKMTDWRCKETRVHLQMTSSSRDLSTCHQSCIPPCGFMSTSWCTVVPPGVNDLLPLILPVTLVMCHGELHTSLSPRHHLILDWCSPVHICKSCVQVYCCWGPVHTRLSARPCTYIPTYLHSPACLPTCQPPVDATFTLSRELMHVGTTARKKCFLA